MDIQRWSQLNTQVAVRDKLARIIQYASRAIWGTLDQIDSSPGLADYFKTIEYIFSTFRKLLRFGKCLDIFYASLRTVHYPDLTLRVSLTLSKLSQSLFLFADHMLWLARTGLFKNINSRWWSERANKFWLFSIIMNLCRDLYEIMRLIELRKTSKAVGVRRRPAGCPILTSRDLKMFVLHSYGLFWHHRDVALDTVKNVCDFFIPLTALGYTKLTPQTVGLLGAISSVAGLWALVEPRAKLSPI